MKIHIVVAMRSDGLIGTNGGLPWRIPSDMRRFKALTTGHPVIMGRRTYNSLPDRSRPLPNRTNIVISREAQSLPGNPFIARSLDAAVEQAYVAPGSDKVFVIGGAQIYAEAWPRADIAHVTVVDAPLDLPGDVFFPEVEMGNMYTTMQDVTPKLVDPNDPYRTRLMVYQRVA